MKRRVMLVDDSPLVLSGLKRALNDEPYEVLIETSATEALRTLAHGKVDVVVSDHDMPEMNGAVFLAEVCKLDPSIVRFMLTGKATLDMAISAINEGTVDRFFTKPCNHVDLAVTLRGALEQKDLLADSRKLLHRYKQQEEKLADFEKHHPVLTQVDRDETGAILLDDIPEDCESLRKLMNEILEMEDTAPGTSTGGEG